MKFLNVSADLADIKQLVLKIRASVLLALIFTYFWVYGPLQEVEPLFNQIAGDSTFLQPIMLGKDHSNSEFTIINSAQESHFGYKLINWRTKSDKSFFGLIADSRLSPAMDEALGLEILQRAKKHSFEHGQAVLKTALDMYYVEYSKNNKLTELYFETTGLTNDIKGYAGPIKLAIFIKPDGTITKISYLGSDETTSYIEKIRNLGFFDQFSRMNLFQNQSVDAISGATLSTQAIARSVVKVVNVAADSPLSNYMDEDVGQFEIDARLTSSWIIDAVIISFIFVLAWQRKIRKTKIFIVFLSAFSIAYIGFYLNHSFTYITILHSFLGVSISKFVAFYVAISLLAAVWDNNTYCKYVCPFGNIQKLLHKLMPFSIKLPVKARHLKILRLLLTITLITGLFLGMRDWASFELFPDIFGIDFSSIWFWVAIILVLISAVIPMFWCRVLCPTGAVLDGVTDLCDLKTYKSLESITIRLENKPQTMTLGKAI